MDGVALGGVGGSARGRACKKCRVVEDSVIEISKTR